MSDKEIMVKLPNQSPTSPKMTLKEHIGLMGHVNMPRQSETVFEDPSKYMKEIEKGWTYAWPKNDRYLKARLRSGDYQLVDPEELREDCDLPVEVKKISGEEVVQVGDLILVKVPPAANDRLYKSRAVLGLLNAHNNVAYAAMESQMTQISGGLVKTELEHEEISEHISN